MQVLKRLAEQFEKLPGIGPKSAMRLAHHVLFVQSSADTAAFAQAVRESKSNLKLCPSCFSISEDGLCGICKNSSRSADVLLVVSDVRDLLAIEETGSYKGKYHVLGGLLSPLQRVGPEKLRIAELKNRIAAGQIREVILGTVQTAEGEVTAYYLMDQLKSFDVKLTRLGAGLPVGGALEYMDGMTVSKAILNRQEMSAG